MPHRVVANFSYRSRFDRLGPSLPKRLTQGWTFWGIATASSGFPFTVQNAVRQQALRDRQLRRAAPSTRYSSRAHAEARRTGPEEQFFSNEVMQDNARLIQAVSNNQNFTASSFAVPLDTLNGTHVQAHPGNLGRNTFRASRHTATSIFRLPRTPGFSDNLPFSFVPSSFNVLNQHVFGAESKLTSPGLRYQPPVRVSIPGRFSLGCGFVF